jgi:uncharacterized protein (UPF0335 family)
MNAMERISKILETNLAVIKDLVERVEALERDQDNTEEELRNLIVDVNHHADDINAFRVEIDELAANMDCILDDENAY